MSTDMEDPKAPLKGSSDSSCVSVSREYDCLYQLELRYWSLGTVRKVLRFAACVALAGQLAAAFFCFVASPWAESTDKTQKLRRIACVLLTTFSGCCLLCSITAVLVAWVTSCRAQVGNALLFVGTHLKAIVFSSCACAVSAALLKCIGLQSSPLSLAAAVASCSLLLLLFLLQPVPLGKLWAICVAAVLLFLVGTQRLLAALAVDSLPRGWFTFVGYSHLCWLSPLIVAAFLSAMLLLSHYLQLLLATARGGYYIFCPPNPHLHSLDTLAADAVSGKPLSLSPRKPIYPPSPDTLVQLLREKLTPRRLGPAMAQQRRTVEAPAVIAERPKASEAQDNATGEEAPLQKRVPTEGAWLVALWLRGHFFIASFGALCVATSLLLFALGADSAAAQHGLAGPAAFQDIKRLLLPQPIRHQQEEHLTKVSFVAFQAHESLESDGVRALRSPQQKQQRQQLPQQKQENIMVPLSAVRLRRKLQRGHFQSNALQPSHPSSGLLPAAGLASSELQLRNPNLYAMPEESFLQLRLNKISSSSKEEQPGSKTAAAFLLLAFVLLLPLIGTSLGEWCEDLFFAHMVLIKRNPWMILPPPVLVIQPHQAEAVAATTPKAETDRTNVSDPLLYMARERMRHQSFLGLDAQREEGKQPQQMQQQGQQQQPVAQEEDEEEERESKEGQQPQARSPLQTGTP